MTVQREYRRWRARSRRRENSSHSSATLLIFQRQRDDEEKRESVDREGSYLPNEIAKDHRSIHQRSIGISARRSRVYEIVPHADGFFFKKRHVFRLATAYAACSTG